MIRRLSIVASVVSLLLCVATAALWARSYLTSDSLLYSQTHWGIGLDSNCGELAVRPITEAEPYVLGFGWDDQTGQADKRCNESDALFAGFGRTWAQIDNLGATPIVREPLYWCPYWALAAAFGAAPALLITGRLRQRRRRRAGRCAVCGYDLRATPDRCPECGTASPVDVVHCRRDPRSVHLRVGDLADDVSRGVRGVGEELPDRRHLH